MNRNKHYTFAAIALGLSLLLCVSGAEAQPTSQGLAGHGRWQSLEGDSIRGTWKVGLARTGDKLSGTIAFTGSNVFSEAQVVGTITSSSVTLGVVANGQKQIDFVGSLDGESIRGEWTSDVLGDHGVWYGKLVRGQELRAMAIE